MKVLPTTVSAYKRTATFSQDTIPPGLLRDHTTRAGVWGHIVVLEGKLRYTILEPTPEEFLLDPSRSGVVEPQIKHQVEPVGKVLFFVEFFR